MSASLIGRLGSSNERPHSRTAEKRYEFAPLYVRPMLRRQYRIGSNECFDRGWKRLRYSKMRCRPMSEMGQKARTSVWAHVVRSSP